MRYWVYFRITFGNNVDLMDGKKTNGQKKRVSTEAIRDKSDD